MGTPNMASTIAVTIPNGAAGLSAAVNLSGQTLLEIRMPAAWVAAALTFQTGGSAAACQDLYDEDGEVILDTPGTVAASRNIRVPVHKFAGCQFLKVRSGTASAPVNQTADRTLTLVVMP